MTPLIQLSDFVGEHGSYQLYISVVLFLRYVLLGLMANSGPLMTPDVTFYCSLPMEEIVAIMPNITTLNQTEQELEIREEFKRICQLDLHLYQEAYLSNSSQLLPAAPSRRKFNATDKIRECADFTYDIAPDQGRTMTSEFDLVCDRDMLRSLFQSLLSAAIVVAHVFWGTFSDKYGRFKAQKLCLLISLAAGVLSVMAVDFWTFMIARALCSFGDLGLVVSLTTTVVELVGNPYRGLSVAVVNFGYALGVAMLPYLVAYCEDFRLVIAFTVICHVLTIPLILTTNESIRWLLTNRKFKLAKRELERISRWNRGAARLLFPRPQTRSSAMQASTAAAHHHHQVHWPGQVKKGNKGDISGSSDEKTWSRRAAERQTFEELFEMFIEQVESQNLCDPLGAAADGATTTSDQCESSSSSSSDAGGAVSPVVDIVVTVPDGAVCSQPQPVDSNGNNSDHDNHRTNFNGTSAENAATDVPRNKPQPAEGRTAKSATVSLLAPMMVPIARSGSCGELSAAPDVGGQVPPVLWPPTSLVSRQLLIGGNSEQDYRTTSAKASRKLTVSLLDVSSLLAAASANDFITSAERTRRIRAARSELLPGSRASPDSNEDGRHCRVTVVTPSAFGQPGGGCGQQPECINLVAHQLSFVGRVNRLFRDKQLMIAVFTIVWTTFNSELQYTSFIIINLEVGEDIYLNYILGGCMEALAAVTASLLLSYAPRRESLIAFWLLISISCFGLSVAHIDSTWAVWLLAQAKFCQSSLSTIACVAAYESFPTFLRQSGSGLVFTLGMLGSVFAPLIFAEFDDHAGMDRVLMTFSFSSLTAAILIYLFLRETRNCELQ